MLGLGLGLGPGSGLEDQGVADRRIGRCEVGHLAGVRAAAEAAVELVLAALEEVDDMVRVLLGDLPQRPERFHGVQDPVAEPRPAGVEARVV